MSRYLIVFEVEVDVDSMTQAERIAKKINNKIDKRYYKGVEQVDTVEITKFIGNDC